MKADAEFWAAVMEGDTATLEGLLAAEPKLSEARDDNGASAVLVALYHRQPAVARLLRGHKSTLDIYEAAALNDVEALEPYLKKKRKIDKRASDGFRALHLAAFFGAEAAVRRLLEAGANPSRPSKNAMAVRPINSAAAAGALGAVQALLDAGAEVDETQAGDITPLMSAAATGNSEIIELLLERGADPARRSADGKRAREYAEERGQHHALRLLPAGQRAKEKG